MSARKKYPDWRTKHVKGFRAEAQLKALMVDQITSEEHRVGRGEPPLQKNSPSKSSGIKGVCDKP